MVMNTIYVIKQSELMSAVHGKFKTFLLLYLGLPFLIFGSICALVWGEGAFVKTIGLSGVLFFGYGGWLLLRGEQEYKPGKTFPFLRQSKEKIRVLTYYFGIAGIVVLSLFFVFSLLGDSGSLAIASRCLIGIPVLIFLIYYTNKSFEVHEDVDYVTSSEMESIIGVENDEKIQVTYQNFDSSIANGLEDGCNMIMATDKKLFFAFYESGKWSYVNKRIDEIQRLGYMGTESELFFELEFTDSTTIITHMNIMGETTNNSTLFLKRFLEILDSVVLGTVDEKIKSRRRVSINKDNSSVLNEVPITEGRKLEISNYIVEGLKTAVPVESGRILEF